MGHYVCPTGHPSTNSKGMTEFAHSLDRFNTLNISHPGTAKSAAVLSGPKNTPVS